MSSGKHSVVPWGTDIAANMKVITSIYLNCRPELRDEWLAGTDQDTELEDALVSCISS